ncbi:hypothetical protein M9H77_02984 [Catharanthus roseus]|uniref:Uncharacterized protein n=1 Tax=Catharanthus roseus TaxID=4058 RepID=A0ACC0CA04_CATRO|nr:hypothetical protein M9H77_02984 [Catharanthus roseus]
MYEVEIKEYRLGNAKKISLEEFGAIKSNPTIYPTVDGSNYGAHNQGRNVYGGINHSGTNFTSRRQDGVDEDDKAILASCSFSPSILEYIFAYRRKGVGFNTWSELKGIENEESMKPSLLEKSSIANELLQARIEIDESVEMHVEGEMFKEDFGDSMNNMSFEEENDLEENERTKEMNQKKSGGKGVLLSPTNSLISFLTNSSPTYHEFYSKELKLFLNAYAFHEIIVGTLCAIFRTCDLCLINVHLPNCLSFHDSLWNQLLSRDAKLEQSCFDLKFWHDIPDIISLVVDLTPSQTPIWGMIPSNFLDLFVENLLVKKVEGYLCSLIEDFLDRSIRRIVKRCFYLILFFETFGVVLYRIAPFENHFLNVKVQLDIPCDDHKFLIGLEFLKAFLIGNIFGLQFYHLHFKEYVFVNL